MKTKTEQDLEKKIEKRRGQYKRAVELKRGSRFRFFGEIEKSKAKLEGYKLAKKEIKDKIEDKLKDIEFTKDNLEDGEDYGEDDEADLIHFHQLEGRRLALEELKSLLEGL